MSPIRVEGGSSSDDADDQASRVPKRDQATAVLPSRHLNLVGMNSELEYSDTSFTARTLSRHQQLRRSNAVSVSDHSAPAPEANLSFRRQAEGGANGNGSQCPLENSASITEHDFLLGTGDSPSLVFDIEDDEELAADPSRRQQH